MGKEEEESLTCAHLQFVPPTNMMGDDDLQTLQKASGNSNYPSPLEKLNECPPNLLEIN
jgi:hypothetical protein